MGKVLNYVMLILCSLVLACKCPPNEKDVLLTPSQKIWLSKAPPPDSLINVFSDNGLSDLFSIESSAGINKDVVESENGSCPKYEIYESKRISYFSKFTGFYFNFQIYTSESPVKIRGGFYRGSLPYTDCTFSILADKPDSISYFNYYPYIIEQKEGFQWVGDTSIQAQSYLDMYRFNINLKNNQATALDIKVLYFSRSRGLVAFKTFNNVNWYLYP